jgi:hypothetical protein|tara:strand:+ start:1199 stop:1555 length:357 start_codon:yes stop_codon:yes gene_type:complete
MNYRALIIGAGLFFIAQVLSWFQTNGQFLNTWVKDHPVLVAALMGVPIGMSYIYGTTYIVEAFDGKLWPSRLIGFATGIFSFTVLTFVFMKEGVNIKTGIILTLAILILSLQIFWKYD